MQVILQYFDGCPNWEVADHRLQELAHGSAGVPTADRLRQVLTR